MSQTLMLVVAVLVALSFNVEWTWQPSSTSTISFGGPPGGIALCGLVCMMLIYRSFIAIQDFLIAKRYLTARVTTAFDLLPWIVLLPLTIGYIGRGNGWVFQWGESKLKFWYFIAILVSVFVLQVYTLIRRIAENAKGND
jgi:hypothetical protein